MANWKYATMAHIYPSRKVASCMSRTEFRLVRVVPTGTGSKRITIPKDLLTEVLGNSEYATISKREGGLIIQPAEVRPRKS